MEKEEGHAVGVGQPHLVCPLPRNLLLLHLQLKADYEQILSTSRSNKTKTNKQKTRSASFWRRLLHSTLEDTSY